ncbi:hypothetical protein CCAN12_770031 [Capnocytophaga canimorsus]|uniref:TRAM domain-containing protein n=1 Tax=Capnocytophaga canimorsus TaxID=28188 RepID=A0A0B7HQ64_9FLAO|nr:hypothetical protein CCAN12_770031 [Capnocytophaga canimorsus]
MIEKRDNTLLDVPNLIPPDVDNEVLIDASKHYVKTGDFVNVKITDAADYDLYGEPVK